MAKPNEEYYIFDGMIPAKTVPVTYEDTGKTYPIPHLYRGGGKWEYFNDPEAWDMNAVKETKAKVDALITKFDKKK
jgi:hypothetical protein